MSEFPGAVLYARVSDAKQADAEVSIPAQLEAGARRIEELGAKLLRTFMDEGRSAFREGNRPVFETAIDYAVTHACKYFITWSSARFARNKIEAALYKRELDRAGVRLIYLDMDIDRSTDAGWMLDGMLEIFDEMKSRQTSVDTKRSMIRNAEQGFFTGGRPPFGFVNVPHPENPKRNRLIPLPDEAERAREVFALRMAGYGGKAIADRFNALSVRYRGRAWKKDTVLHLLRSEAMIGLTVFNRMNRRINKVRPRDEWLVLKTHEPIIDAATWSSVQADMDSATESTTGRGHAKSGFLFSGLLKCEQCGGALVIETGGGNGGQYSYYSCRRGRRNDLCVKRRYPAKDLDAFLTEVVFDHILDRKSLADMVAEIAEASGEWKKAQGVRRIAMSRKLQDVQGRNRKLYEVLEEFGRDAPNLGDMTQRLRANNDEAKRLEIEIKELEAEPPPVADIEGLDLDEVAQEVRSFFTESSTTQRLRAFYRSFIGSVVMRAETAEITYEPSAVMRLNTPMVIRHGNWRPKLDSNQRPPD